MKVLFIDTDLNFSLIPRKYPTINDTLSVTLRNEDSDLKIVPNFSFSVNEKLNITLENNSDFKVSNKYEVEIKNDGDIIYLGKLLFLEENTDVQNYTYGSQPNSKFQYE
jgi:hypothetical protein